MKKILFLFAVVSTVLVSCSKNSSSTSSRVKLGFAGSLPTLKSSSDLATSDLSINNITVVVKEIKLEVDHDYYEHSMQEHMHDAWHDSTYSDKKLAGPFIIELMKDGQPFTNVVDLGMVPNAQFEKIEFKVDKSDAVPATDTMHGKSIQVTGTYNGTPFVIWDNEDHEFSVDYTDTTDIILIGESLQVKVNFDIQTILNALSTFEFSAASDGNGNGVIEIGPGDPDGNSDLLHHILGEVEHSCRLEHD